MQVRHVTHIRLQGGFAKVYKATCIPRNEACAVKVLELEKLGSGIDEVRVRTKAPHTCIFRAVLIQVFLVCTDGGRRYEDVQSPECAAVLLLLLGQRATVGCDALHGPWICVPHVDTTQVVGNYQGRRRHS